jgi:peptidoglycan hydrolase-like protein with peptidoglycan-binding domain
MPDLWNAYGFRWGGDYNGKKDSMHYEFLGSVSEAASMTQKAAKNNLGGSGASTQPPPVVTTPPPASGSYTPGVLPLPAGYYYGPKNGPTESISGMAGEPAHWIAGLKDAQNRLMVHQPGCLPKYGADGKYGETAAGETHDATVRFQQGKGLGADGLIGPNTWNALFKAPVAAPTAPAFPLPGGYYYGPKNGPTESISGMAGESQAWINGLVQAQQRLMAHIPGCLPKYGADGKYGETLSGETHDATKRFQGMKGLPQDALIGPNTWKALWV